MWKWHVIFTAAYFWVTKVCDDRQPQDAWLTLCVQLRIFECVTYSVSLSTMTITRFSIISVRSNFEVCYLLVKVLQSTSFSCNHIITDGLGLGGLYDPTEIFRVVVLDSYGIL